MDLDRLTIDRGAKSAAPRRSAFPWLRVGLLVLVVIAVWWFRAPLFAKVDRLRLVEVEVAKATRTSALSASADQGVAANGYIVAATRAALSADTPGRIVELNVEEGSVVKRGEVVARLFSDEVKAALDAAEAQVRAARAAVESARFQQAALGVGVEAARVATTAARARLEEANSTRELARKEAERARVLIEKQAIDRAFVDRAEAEDLRAAAAVAGAEAAVLTALTDERRAEAELETAGARLVEAEAAVLLNEALRDRAQATLDKTIVRAPFDGVVVLKDAEVGEVVSPNSQGANSRGSVCTMVDFSSLEVQVDLPEKNLDAAREDMPANVYLDAYPTRRYRAFVSRIWPTANRQKATVEVRIRFLEPDEFLRPEMSVRVVFDPTDAVGANAEVGELVLVPESAVVTLNGETGVFLLERDVARFQRIEAGESRGRRRVVASGLAGGEAVVSSPPSSLVDGDRVRVADDV
ncbi:MAG: efflux RND transporter periplasmic adaptor subunit [Planctomycetota bacterium]